MPVALPRLHRPMHLAMRALRVSLIGVLIAALITIASGRMSFGATVVYSVCISLGCWICIDGGRQLVARWVHRGDRAHPAYGQWPGWPWMVLIVIAGTVAGYTVGVAAGNWLTGFRSPGLAAGSLRQALALFTVALVPSVAATYFFYARERIAASEAAAETARRQAAENQLKLLESQLEPHMLFNTLANLRALIGIDPPRAQAMLDRMIAFLRATLAASRASLHPLHAEFARLDDYLALMAMRMGPRLRVSTVLPEALRDTPVPALLLQPLVENAIKHGLEPKVEGGEIEVRAEREANALLLTVRDSGVGIAPGAAGGGFGCTQVRERLRTLYGDAAAVSLEPAPAGGTLARIRLPLSTP